MLCVEREGERGPGGRPEMTGDAAGGPASGNVQIREERRAGGELSSTYVLIIALRAALRSRSANLSTRYPDIQGAWQ